MLPIRRHGPTFRNGCFVRVLVVHRGSGPLSAACRDGLVSYGRVLGLRRSARSGQRRMLCKIHDHGDSREAPACLGSAHRRPCWFLCLGRAGHLAAAVGSLEPEQNTGPREVSYGERVKLYIGLQSKNRKRRCGYSGRAAAVPAGSRPAAALKRSPSDGGSTTRSLCLTTR